MTKLLELPTIPYIGVNITIKTMNTVANPILLIRITLAFSSPRNFELIVNDNVPGITAKLIICIATTASTYSGKIIGKTIGVNNSPPVIIIIDEIIAMILLLTVLSPAESCGNV